MIEIGKEYIYNYNSHNSKSEMKQFDKEICTIIDHVLPGTFIVIFEKDLSKKCVVHGDFLSPISEKTDCATCDHNIHDCIVCPEMNDDSKYKRAWEALQRRLSGIFHPVMINKIYAIMDEVLKDETN